MARWKTGARRPTKSADAQRAASFAQRAEGERRPSGGPSEGRSPSASDQRVRRPGKMGVSWRREACMNFDFSEDQKLLQKTARDYLAEHCGLDVCRSVLESNGTHSDALWKGVAEMGWLGAAVPEEYGGAGFSRLELALIAQELGRALAPIPFGPSVCLVTEALLEFGSAAQKREYLPRLVSGELIGTYAQSERAGRSGVAAVTTTLSGGALTGVKFPVPDGG